MLLISTHPPTYSQLVEDWSRANFEMNLCVCSDVGGCFNNQHS